MKRYPAKLLLFGEHILLTGAPALAAPVRAFGGHWAQSAGADQRRLREFSVYLSEQLAFGPAFGEALQEGLYFEANIPEGYGLGSSGALCAAVYDRFAPEKTDDLSQLKQIFARMESFFHGNSSGIDPLTSYIDAPLLIENKNQVSRVIPRPWPEKPVVFLIDSALPRQTGPLVQWFLQQYAQEAFRKYLERYYLPAHHTLLESWLNARAADFWPALAQVSAIQFRHFTPMIPDTLRDLWQESLAQDAYQLKICGAGGGGYMLGFAQEESTVAQLAARRFSIQIIQDLL